MDKYSSNYQKNLLPIYLAIWLGISTFCTKSAFGTGVGAAATVTVTDGVISAISVTSGGTGYKSAPTILIINTDGGTGATAIATVSDGAVTGVTINDGGSGYTASSTGIIFAPAENEFPQKPSNPTTEIPIYTPDISTIPEVPTTSPPWWKTNSGPTAVNLNQLSIPENLGSEYVISAISATDSDENDTHTFTLVDGDGGSDNASFAISGSSLLTTQTFDFETKSSYAIRLQVTDSAGELYQQVFTIQITDDTSEDTDGDGLTESQEDSLGTSDLLADTDSDGANDLDEVNAGSDPTDSSSTPSTIPSWGWGTGFCITEDGYLLTNHHVIENAVRVEVLLGGKYHKAQVISSSEENDLALLKITGHFETIPLSSSDDVSLGKDVFTMGYPETSGTPLTITEGVLNLKSNVSQTYTEGEVNILKPWGQENLFQISTPLHKGNSGGALVDNYGNVVGVVVGYLPGIEIQNINYAVKSNYALDLISKAGVSGKLTTPYSSDTTRQKSAIISETENSTGLIISFLNQTAVEDLSPIYSWNAASSLGNGWKHLDWFSSYYDNGNNWLYHPNLGWLYKSSANGDSIWLWDDSMGWVWTTSSIYPFLYSNSRQGWLYQDKSSFRQFWDYSVNAWSNL